MRCSAPLCAAALAAVAFLAPAVRAQIQVFGGADNDRRGCSLFLADTSGGDFAVKGAVAINYSAPQWQAAYEEKIDSEEFKGTNQRLGKNWWTSLETSVALDIGGAKVMPGIYYLGIHVDQAGKFHLLVIDSKAAMTKGMTPFMPDSWKADFKAPLTLARNSLKAEVAKMEIEISADKGKPTSGKFAIRWGKHELSAPVTILIDGAKDASAGK